MPYNYRDTQKHAVANTFNDLDFAAATIVSRGHKVKPAYKISKNFSTGVAYFATLEDDTPNNLEKAVERGIIVQVIGFTVLSKNFSFTHRLSGHFLEVLCNQ